MTKEDIMKREKEINTPELSIAGNVVAWKNTIIQLSNVSSLSTVALDPVAFPLWTIVGSFIAIILIPFKLAFLTFLFWVLAAIVIYAWYKQNQEIAKQRNLIIMMNSGKVFVIGFKDKEFLEKVYGVLSSIIAEGNESSEHIRININNSTISGEAHVLNDLIL